MQSRPFKWHIHLRNDIRFWMSEKTTATWKYIFMINISHHLPSMSHHFFNWWNICCIGHCACSPAKETWSGPALSAASAAFSLKVENMVQKCSKQQITGNLLQFQENDVPTISNNMRMLKIQKSKPCAQETAWNSSGRLMFPLPITKPRPSRKRPLSNFPLPAGLSLSKLPGPGLASKTKWSL